jgi:capsular polysaccharide biosynthesis protein
MDLTEIVQTIWRHKRATIPVILLTLAGLAYVAVLKPKVYQAKTSYMLVNPPDPPTSQQIAADPALGKLNSNNPYVRYGDLTVVVGMLADELSANSERAALIAKGADPNFEVAQDLTYGDAPILDITGYGASPAAADLSANTVGQGTIQLLNTLQKQQGVSSQYDITALPVQGTPQATLEVSSLLRTAAAVLALGVIMLFIVVSTATGMAERREERRRLAGLDPQPGSGRGGLSGVAAPEELTVGERVRRSTATGSALAPRSGVPTRPPTALTRPIGPRKTTLGASTGIRGPVRSLKDSR